ncbi:hypothetical protein ACK3Z8_03720 [Aeromonas caviae]|uniref:hypothetical protein n=1 Tax=Aeromonas caviae TaxID=648 RepID=UPI0038D06BB0
MEIIYSIFVGLAGAFFGGYFAVLKGRRERLWLDRYETLKELVHNLCVIESYYCASYMNLRGECVISNVEITKLKEECPEAMRNIRLNCQKLRILFDDVDLFDIREQFIALQSAFQDAYGSEQDEIIESHDAISQQAKSLSNEIVSLSQKYRNHKSYVF